MPLRSESISPQALSALGKPFKALGKILTSQAFLTSLRGFGKGLVLGGTAAVRGLGVVSNAVEIKQNWQDKDKSLLSKIGTTIVNVGAMTVGTIGILAAFGVMAIAAPVMGVIIGGVSLVKSVADLAMDWQKAKKIKRDIAKHEAELKAFKLNFETNNTLHKDLLDSQRDIDNLQARLGDINHTLNVINTKKTSESDLEDAAQFRVAHLEDKIYKNQILKKNAQSLLKIQTQIDSLSRQIEIAPEKEKTNLIAKRQKLTLKLESRRNFSQTAENEPEKIKVLTLSKSELEQTKAKLFKEGAQKKGHPKHNQFIENELKIKVLERKIDKHVVLLRQNEKLLSLQNEKLELENEIQDLNEKYQVYDPDIRQNLVDLNKQYLEARIATIDEKINLKTDPSRNVSHRGKKIIALTQERDTFNDALVAKTLRAEYLKGALQEALEHEKHALMTKLEQKQQVYQNKVEYLGLFIEKNANQADYENVQGNLKPIYKKVVSPLIRSENTLLNMTDVKHKKSDLGQLPRAIKQDAAEILRLQTKISKRKGELKVQKIRKRSRWKNIGFAAVMLGLGIATLMFPPAALGLLVATAVVGTIACTSYIMDYRKEAKAKKQAKKEYEEEVLGTLKELDEQMKTHRKQKSATKQVQNELTEEIKALIDSEIENIAEHFVPQPSASKNSGERVVHLLDDAVTRILQHESIQELSPQGQEKLKAYLASKETHDRIYDIARHARADHFYKKLLNPSIDLNANEDGLKWIRFPRARREVIEEMFKNVQKDDTNFPTNDAKQRALEHLKHIYIEAIREDLQMMPKEVDEKLMVRLPNDHILNTPVQFVDDDPDKEALLAEFRDIVNSKSEVDEQKALELYADNTTPAFDINMGLFEKLDSALFHNYSRQNFEQTTNHISMLYKKDTHQALLKALTEIQPLEARLNAINKLVSGLHNDIRFEDYRAQGQEISQAFEHEKGYTSTQKTIIEQLQDLYIKTLEQAAPNGKELNLELTENLQALLANAPNTDLMKMETSKDRSQALEGKLQEISQKSKQAVQTSKPKSSRLS